LLRAFLFKTALITAFVVFGILTILVALAYLEPLSPGSLLFPIQDFAEQQGFFIYPDPVGQAGYALDLVEQRIADLVYNTGTKNEVAALRALDKAIDQASNLLARVPDEQGVALRTRLLSLAQNA